RYEFALLDYAIWAAGAVSVTIYETSSAEQVEWIIGNSESVAVLCETPELAAIYHQVAAGLPSCRHASVITAGGLDEIRDAATTGARAEVERRIAAIRPDDLATLVYTSGTTGRPKGCMLTHGNFIFEVRQLEERVPAMLTENQRTLIFLPMAHIASRLVEVGCISVGVQLGFATSAAHLAEELAMFRPTWMFAVPRVFEKIYNTAEQRAHAGGKGAVFERAAQVAIRYSESLDKGGAGLGTKLIHRLFDKLVYSKIRPVFGGELSYVISGAAPLGARLGHFFRGIGVIPIEVYGLTETTGVSTANGTDRLKIGTVGTPLGGVSIRIADDGEILIKGAGTMRAYWRNEEATAEAIDPDGWFHSGDIGTLDSDGFVSITGRKKEIIVTAGGKNVAPAVLEDRLRGHSLVSQCMVVGDAKPFVAALVTIDEESLAGWAEIHERDAASLPDLIDDPDLLTAIQSAVDEANRAVSKAESIRAFRILPNDLTIEGGELTPTLKVKRSVVAAKYGATIDDIYVSA
ncbi:MAG: long-chain fatty acid--CoA ligase, partial [Acidimicrobiia bacterium]|nr:long-chain fatty acid--CoA ligase [Acidimicrobiia bacterium]